MELHLLSQGDLHDKPLAFDAFSLVVAPAPSGSVEVCAHVPLLCVQHCNYTVCHGYKHGSIPCGIWMFQCVFWTVQK